MRAPGLSLPQFLDSENGNRIGSLGEYVFAAWATSRGHHVQPVHHRRTDFLVDGHRVDVKSYSKYFRSRKAFSRPSRFTGSREDDVTYAVVDFHQAGATLSENGQVTGDFSLEQLETLFVEWAAAKSTRKGLRGVSVDLTGWNSIRSELAEAFGEAGFPAPFSLYRTVDFGPKESPHNLLPSARRAADRTGFTVFVHCASSPPHRNSVRRIFAFPDSAETEFLIGQSALANDMPKVDLRSIGTRYQFHSLDALLAAVRSGSLPAQ